MARILVVDDDKRIRALIRRGLKKLGHEVVEAGDGAAALERLRADPVDLLITDLYMPGMEGLELIQKVRAAWPELGIIAISGGTADTKFDFLPVADSLGADDVLAKPLDLDRLRDLVDARLGSQVDEPDDMS